MPVHDPVAIRHPKLPGRDPIVIARSAFPSHERRGWVEAKSPAAKAAVEASTPTEGDSTPKEN